MTKEFVSACIDSHSHADKLKGNIFCSASIISLTRVRETQDKTRIQAFAAVGLSIYYIDKYTYMVELIYLTRSLGALRALTSSWRPFGPLDFVLHALRALRPCDTRVCDWIALSAFG